MKKLQLKCKNNRRKGLWLLAKVKDTYSKYMYEDYRNEYKYINNLTDEEKEWLNLFLLGYYHQSKPAMDKLNFPIALRRARYNQHRGVKNDIYNKRTRLINPSDPRLIFENIIFEDPSIGLENTLMKTTSNKEKD